MQKTEKRYSVKDMIRRNQEQYSLKDNVVFIILWTTLSKLH